MIEPSESHLYNRRLYAPTFPHYQPHWYPETRLRDAWQFPRPPMRLRECAADFMLDTSSDAFPPLGKELEPECMLEPEGAEVHPTTTLTAAAPSWSPPWAFPSPLLTAEPEPKDVDLAIDSSPLDSPYESPQTGSPPAEAAGASSSSTSPSSTSSTCSSSASSSSSAELVLSSELVQLSLFSETQSFSSAEGTPLPATSHAKPSRSTRSHTSATTSATTPSSSGSTSTAATAPSSTSPSSATTTTQAAAAARTKKKTISVPRAAPTTSSRTSPRGANYPTGPALLSAAPFQSFAPAPFASSSGNPAAYYRQPAGSCCSASNRSSSPSHAYYAPAPPPNSSSFYSMPGVAAGAPKPIPFPITAASWTSEMLPAKPRGNNPGKPQAAPAAAGTGVSHTYIPTKKATKVALKPAGSEVTVHVAKPPSFAPRVQTEEDSSYQSFTPRRIQGGAGGQTMFPQAATFSAGQPYPQEGPYSQRPPFNPSFNGGYAPNPHSPSHPYPANFTPRFPQKGQAPPSQQYGSNSNNSNNNNNFAGAQGGFAYPSPSPHGYPPPFNQEGPYPSGYPYPNNGQYPAEYPSPQNFAYKQQRQQQQQQQPSSAVTSSSSSSSSSPSSSPAANHNNQEGEGGGNYDEQQQQYQQQQQQYPYEAGYPTFPQSGW